MEETTRESLENLCLSLCFISLTLTPTTHTLQQTYGLPMIHEGEGSDPNTGHVPEQAKLHFINALCVPKEQIHLVQRILILLYSVQSTHAWFIQCPCV